MGHSSQLWNGSQIIIYGGWNGFQVLSDVIFIDLKKGVGKFCLSYFLQRNLLSIFPASSKARLP